MSRNLLLLTPINGPALSRLERIFRAADKIEVVATAQELATVTIDSDTTLLSFGSGVIVPAVLFKRLKKPAYNLHAASPEFPGRDPHHHAKYRGARSYGATLHLMTEQVDAGPIVAVKSFPVTASATPEDLLAQANEAGFRILEELGPSLLETEPLPFSGQTWGAIKTKREDLIRASELSPLIDAQEFERRYQAFGCGNYGNLALRLHGRTFRIDKAKPLPPVDSNAFAEFTEHGFRQLLKRLKSGGYRFARYGEANTNPHVLWRHDIDFSMHRAARLASIEQEEGAQATYFLNPHSGFYNLLEPSITALARRIGEAGHDLALHFDDSSYGVKKWSADQLVEAIAKEHGLLEAIVERPVKAVSWHNPEQSNLLDFAGETVGGLVNSYSERLQRDYVYASDSNGYWRFKPMAEIIAEGYPRLHL